MILRNPDEPPLTMSKKKRKTVFDGSNCAICKLLRRRLREYQSRKPNPNIKAPEPIQVNEGWGGVH